MHPVTFFGRWCIFRFLLIFYIHLANSGEDSKFEPSFSLLHHILVAQHRLPLSWKPE